MLSMQMSIICIHKKNLVCLLDIHWLPLFENRHSRIFPSNRKLCKLDVLVKKKEKQFTVLLSFICRLRNVWLYIIDM